MEHGAKIINENQCEGRLAPDEPLHEITDATRGWLAPLVLVRIDEHRDGNEDHVALTARRKIVSVAESMCAGKRR
jgi:hypothetical protein